METVDVIIGIFGDEPKWSEIAQQAATSVHGANHVWQVYRSNLSAARNDGAKWSKADWLIFLDADDELDVGYIPAMIAGSGDLRYPSTIGIYEDDSTDDFAVPHLPTASLLHTNHMVIGTMVRREMFLDVGGFRDLPILEDWDLWLRCVLSGAVPVSCPEAVYKVHVRPGSRNNPDIHGKTYMEIQQRYQVEWSVKGLK